MAKLIIGETSLQIRLSPLEMLATLSASFEIPAASILGAYLAPADFTKDLGIRLPGTAVPWLYYAGTYVHLKRKSFCVFKRGQQPLALNLTGHRFDRVIIGVDDAQSLADDINERITAC